MSQKKAHSRPIIKNIRGFCVAARIAGIILISLLGISSLSAEETPKKLEDRDRLYIRVGTYIIGHNNTNISLTSPYVLGVNLSTTEDLNMQSPSQVARLDGYYRIKGNHAVGFSYYKIDQHGQTQVRQEIELPDPDDPDGSITLPVGAQVESYLNTDILKLNYLWSFYNTPRTALALNAGLHITRMEASVKGEVVVGDPQSEEDVSADVTAPLPVLGLRFSYKPKAKIRLIYESNVFLISIADYAGSYTDHSLSAEYQFWRFGGLGGGFNFNRLDIKAKDSNSDRRLAVDSETAAAQLYFFFRF
jgi:hypothetical protein